MKKFRKIVAGVLITSFLLQPLGLISVAWAETVEMEYTDPDPLHAPKVVNGVNGVTYVYDANGNLVNDGERTIEWNQDNKPTKITKGDQVVEFFYDAGGQRVVKRSPQGTLTYVNELYHSFTDSQGDVTNTKHYFANGRVAQRTGDDLVFLHQDHLGSTVLATNSTSEPTSNPLSYFPYGSPVNNLTMEQFNRSSYLFTGQEKDPESDLYNYNARLYNPKTGVFISADSVGGGNRYAYAANNPMRFTDPTGHMLDAGGGGSGNLADLEYEITGGEDLYEPPSLSATEVLDPWAELSPEARAWLKERYTDPEMLFLVLGAAGLAGTITVALGAAGYGTFALWWYANPALHTAALYYLAAGVPGTFVGVDRVMKDPTDVGGWVVMLTSLYFATQGIMLAQTDYQGQTVTAMSGKDRTTIHVRGLKDFKVGPGDLKNETPVGTAFFDTFESEIQIVGDKFGQDIVGTTSMYMPPRLIEKYNIAVTPATGLARGWHTGWQWLVRALYQMTPFVNVPQPRTYTIPVP